jgi:hypothetical protein
MRGIAARPRYAIVLDQERDSSSDHDEDEASAPAASGGVPNVDVVRRR